VAPNVLAAHFPATVGALIRLLHTSAHSRDYVYASFANDLVDDVGPNTPIHAVGVSFTSGL
jgi:hypothetical protein